MEWFKKNAANLISFTRIIFVPLLVYFVISGMYLQFVVLYIFLLVGDAIDGTVARILKSESRIGSLIDSLSDYLFYPTILILFIYIFRNYFLVYKFLIIVPAIFTVVPKIVGILYLKNIPHLHLVLWQATNYIVAMWIILSMTFGFNYYFLLVVDMFVLSASMEELLIHIIGKDKLDQSVRSIFNLWKQK